MHGSTRLYVLNPKCNFPLSSGVFPIAVPPCKGTHGNRVAGENTRSRHNLRHFSYYATSPVWQLRNRTPHILVLYVKSDARYGRRLAAQIPSSKSHSPFISALRIGCSLRAHLKNFVILSLSKDLVETKRQTFLRPCHNYSLLIVNY